jgi:hypothetical protein
MDFPLMLQSHPAKLGCFTLTYLRKVMFLNPPYENIFYFGFWRLPLRLITFYGKIPT